MIMNWLEHTCANLPAGGVSIVSSSGYGRLTEWEWCLVIEREATEADLDEAPLLEQVGETMWTTVIGILHCPFCGDRLSSTLKPCPAVAQFQHSDCTKWDSKIQ